MSGVAEAGISVAGVPAISQNVGISLSLPLGDMDDSSRVGDVTSGTGVGSSDSRDGSRGKASNVHGSRGGHTGVASSVGGSVTSVAKSSVASTVAGVAEAVVAKQVWVG